MSEWSMVSLGELTVNLDARRKPVKEPDRKAGPYPYYGASGIVDYVEGYLFEGEHLLIAEDGENLRTRQLPIAFMANGKFWVNNHAHIVVGNEKADTRYLMYAMQSTDVSGFLTGAVMPKLTQGNLNRIPLPCPPLDIQLGIVRILGDLDDKIELNRQINQTLEQIAQTIFKSWFVDFEPVKAKIAAKAAGRDPERAAMEAIAGRGGFQTRPGSTNRAGLEPAPTDQLPPEQRQQLAATAALFPDELVESELGLIPKEWEMSTIGQEVTVVGGSTPSTANPEFWDGEFAWVTPKDLSGISEKVLIGSERKITAAGVDKISSGQLPIGTVLLSSRAPIGYLALSMIPVSINQGFIAMRCDKRLPNTYVLQWATTNLDAIKQRGSGTTFAEISKSNFRPMTVLVPDTATLAEFHKRVFPLYEQITGCVREIETLATLRDTLLPKLLSGELSIGTGG